jgi:hypothetical protein
MWGVVMGDKITVFKSLCASPAPGQALNQCWLLFLFTFRFIDERSTPEIHTGLAGKRSNKNRLRGSMGTNAVSSQACVGSS